MTRLKRDHAHFIYAYLVDKLLSVWVLFSNLATTFFRRGSPSDQFWCSDLIFLSKEGMPVGRGGDERADAMAAWSSSRFGSMDDMEKWQRFAKHFLEMPRWYKRPVQTNFTNFGKGNAIKVFPTQLVPQLCRNWGSSWRLYVWVPTCCGDLDSASISLPIFLWTCHIWESKGKSHTLMTVVSIAEICPNTVSWGYKVEAPGRDWSWGLGRFGIGLGRVRFENPTCFTNFLIWTSPDSIDSPLFQPRPTTRSRT